MVDGPTHRIEFGGLPTLRRAIFPKATRAPEPGGGLNLYLEVFTSAFVGIDTAVKSNEESTELE
jgi:hypothetical protein